MMMFIRVSAAVEIQNEGQLTNLEFEGRTIYPLCQNAKAGRGKVNGVIAGRSAGSEFRCAKAELD